MRLTTRGRYAITAVLDVALHSHKGPVALHDIAKRQDIPVSYLGQLFASLRQQGLVNSRRGPGGGYVLARQVAYITLADIVDAVDEKLEAIRCGGRADCQNNRQCLTHSLWEDLGNKIHDLLDGISLEQVINDRSVLAVAERQDRDYVFAQKQSPQLPQSSQPSPITLTRNTGTMSGSH